MKRPLAAPAALAATGFAVVGDLVFSPFLTLFVTPVFYLYMEALGERLYARKAVTTRLATNAPA